jgi:hypothetical protein
VSDRPCLIAAAAGGSAVVTVHVPRWSEQKSRPRGAARVEDYEYPSSATGAHGRNGGARSRTVSFEPCPRPIRPISWHFVPRRMDRRVRVRPKGDQGRARVARGMAPGAPGRPPEARSGPGPASPRRLPGRPPPQNAPWPPWRWPACPRPCRDGDRVTAAMPGWGPRHRPLAARCKPFCAGGAPAPAGSRGTVIHDERGTYRGRV